MSKLQDLYTGRARQALVMSEFVIRGYNVAVPEVDRGDDLFVVHDTRGEFWRIQVKTANGSPLKRGGFSAQFSLRRDQLETPYTPDLTYVFAIRFEERWRGCVVITRDALHTLHAVNGVGSTVDRKVVLRLSFRDDLVRTGAVDLSSHLRDFSRWPDLTR